METLKRRIAVILDAIDRAGGDATADPSTRLTQGAGRLHELDGIRGWAALAVVVFHIFYECFGAIFPIFRNPVTHALNGSFAVYVFFVLSGEALSTSFFSGGGTRAIASLAVKRYSRLSIPIFASVLSLLLLQRLGLVFSAPASVIIQRTDWLGLFATSPISFADCVKYAAMNVYLASDAHRQLIPFLWTMSAEMIGSIFVFVVLGAWAALHRRMLLLVLLMLLFLAFNDAAFLGTFTAGLLFGWVRQRGLIDRLRTIRFAQTVSGLAILFVLIVVWRLPLFTARLHAIAAIALVGAIFVNRPATAFFRTRLSRLLGKLSFPLYLIHLSVIVSLTSGLIVWTSAHGMLDARIALGIGLASVLTVLLAALLFEPVELLTSWVGHKLAVAFVAEKKATSPQ